MKSMRDRVPKRGFRVAMIEEMAVETSSEKGIAMRIGGIVSRIGIVTRRGKITGTGTIGKETGNID